jgi:hypothetical protein
VLKRALLRAHVLGEHFQFIGIDDKRRNIEPNRLVDLPCLIFLRIAYAVGTVAPHDQSGIEQHNEAPLEPRKRYSVVVKA